VFGRETIEYLESGCSLVVGTVAADGEPHACRGWGLRVPVPEVDRLHLVLDAADTVALDNIGATKRLALTAADVPTLRSMQLKGFVADVYSADDEDRATVLEFCDAFFGNVVAIDGTDRRLLERLVPRDFVACDVAVDEFYNQTPGPGAGSAVVRGDAT
jgi:hypothetical protein